MFLFHINFIHPNTKRVLFLFQFFELCTLGTTLLNIMFDKCHDLGLRKFFAPNWLNIMDLSLVSSYNSPHFRSVGTYRDKEICPIYIGWALWNRNNFEYKFDDTRLSSFYGNIIGPIKIVFVASWLCKVSALLAVSV